MLCCFRYYQSYFSASPSPWGVGLSTKVIYLTSHHLPSPSLLPPPPLFNILCLKTSVWERVRYEGDMKELLWRASSFPNQLTKGIVCSTVNSVTKGKGDWNCCIVHFTGLLSRHATHQPVLQAIYYLSVNFNLQHLGCPFFSTLIVGELLPRRFRILVDWFKC